MTQLKAALRSGPVRRRSVEEEVYLRLRESVLRNELADGKHLVHADLAKHFGTSRIPVRDALRRLVSDGLVDVDERGTYRVSRCGVEDVEEVYALRQLLESHAVAVAVPRLSADDLAQLERLNEEMEQAAAAGEAETYVALNQTFHCELYESTERPRLMRIIHGLWQGLPPLTPITIESRLAQSNQEHGAIIDALRADDGERAATAMRTHIKAAGAALQDYVASKDGELR